MKSTAKARCCVGLYWLIIVADAHGDQTQYITYAIYVFLYVAMPALFIKSYSKLQSLTF